MKPVQVLLPFVVAMSIAGCGAGTSTSVDKGSSAPSPAAPEAQKPAAGFVENNAANFSMHLPESWKIIDFGSSNMAAKLDEMAKNDPSLVNMLPQLKQMAAAGNFKLFAFDIKNTENNFTDNINVIVQDTPNVKLADLVKANEDQLVQLTGGKPAKGEIVKGNGTDLGLIKWGNSTGPNLKYHTVLGVSKDHVFTFTFTCQAKHEAAFAKTVEQIIPTIKLK